MNLNKIMSMIIGATVAASIVPISAVNASVKLEALDGVINKAKAFSNGKYIFEGYKNDEQDNGVYFFNGNKDVEIEDVNSVGSIYGMNYVNFKADEILFNMATEKVEDDNEESKLTTMESKFRNSVIKKAERYEKTQNLIRKSKIVEDTYCGIWYEYIVAENDDIQNPGKYYTVYLNDSGKYIDVSETLNLDYYTDNKKITLDTYSDLEKNNLTILFEKALIMDQENIYKLIMVAPKMTSQDMEDEISALNLDSSLLTQLETIKALVENGLAKPYIQKISMEQGDKKKDVFIPKTVTTFETYDLDVVDFLINNIKGNNTARVSGNNLYTYTVNHNTDNSEITMNKYVLKKIKDKNRIDGKTVDVRVLELDEDFDYVQNEKIQDYGIDALGNLWTLYKGKIQKFENGKLETKYTVDRTMDRLSVFAENSLIAWNTDNEIYSVVAPVEDKKDEIVENSSENDKLSSEVEFKSGWIKNTDGIWNFKKEDGSLAIGWLKDNSTWYYLNGSGVMQTGWVKVGTEWYYLNTSGAMQTGWFKDTNGKWYYLYDNGVMAYSTVVNGYRLDASGAWVE